MPYFKNSNYSEFNDYLNTIVNENNNDSIINSIVNNELDVLFKFLYDNKYTARSLKNKRIDDPKQAFFVGQFLANYELIERICSKYIDEKDFDDKIEMIIFDNNSSLDILSDLYNEANSLSELSVKYGDNVKRELNVMDHKKIIEKDEKEKECFYKLTKEAKRYMKEHYFFNMEEDKNDAKSDDLRSKMLCLLRKEKKKEEI